MNLTLSSNCSFLAVTLSNYLMYVYCLLHIADIILLILRVGLSIYRISTKPKESQILYILLAYKTENFKKYQFLVVLFNFTSSDILYKNVLTIDNIS